MAEQPVRSSTVADYCGVKIRTVATWRQKGTGPPYTMMGNRAMYFLSDVEEWLRGRQQTKKPEPESDIPEPKKKPRRPKGLW